MLVCNMFSDVLLHEFSPVDFDEDCVDVDTRSTSRSSLGSQRSSSDEDFQLHSWKPRITVPKEATFPAQTSRANSCVAGELDLILISGRLFLDDHQSFL